MEFANRLEWVASELQGPSPLPPPPAVDRKKVHAWITCLCGCCRIKLTSSCLRGDTLPAEAFLEAPNSDSDGEVSFLSDQKTQVNTGVAIPGTTFPTYACC